MWCVVWRRSARNAGIRSRVRPFPDPEHAASGYFRLVASFLVFRELPGVTRDQYKAAQRAADDAARGFSVAGCEVTYLGGFFIPAPARAICIFVAGSAADVAAVNQRAGVPVADILEVIDLRSVAGR